eukprot:5602887-Pyramimonas_sp.AAC.1
MCSREVHKLHRAPRLDDLGHCLDILVAELPTRAAQAISLSAVPDLPQQLLLQVYCGTRMFVYEGPCSGWPSRRASKSDGPLAGPPGRRPKLRSFLCQLQLPVST